MSNHIIIQYKFDRNKCEFSNVKVKAIAYSGAHAIELMQKEAKKGADIGTRFISTKKNKDDSLTIIEAVQRVFIHQHSIANKYPLALKLAL